MLGEIIKIRNTRDRFSDQPAAPVSLRPSASVCDSQIHNSRTIKRTDLKV